MTYTFTATDDLPHHSVYVTQLYTGTTAADQRTKLSTTQGWHPGKTEYYPGMAPREKLAWQQTC